MRTTLAFLTLALFSLMLAIACDSDGDQPESTAPAPPPPPQGGSNRVGALQEAFEADANCQLLVACCGSLEGTTWQSSMEAVCGQVADMQNFQQQVDNLVDAAWQANLCQNTVTTIQSMANDANPLPEACRPAQ